MSEESYRCGEKLYEFQIQSFQGLRAIAFLAIFLAHVGCGGVYGSWGVSIFFVMSGFLMVYHSLDREIHTGIFRQIKYGYNKILRLYPLHIVMLVFATVGEIIHIGILNPCKYLITVIANILLIENWFPRSDIFYSINIVTWYLSATIILYMFFPNIILIIKKMNVQVLVCSIFVTYMLQFILIYIASLYGVEFVKWFAYKAPIVRLGDFWIGCVVGYFFRVKKTSKDRVDHGKSSIQFTILEIIGVTVTLISIFLNSKICNEVLAMLQDTMFLPTSVLIVAVCAYQRGVISRLLKNPILVELGGGEPMGIFDSCSSNKLCACRICKTFS